MEIPKQTLTTEEVKLIHEYNLGAHVSTAGGVFEAIPRAKNIPCASVQIFTKNNNRWDFKGYTKEIIHNFKEALNDAPSIKHIFSHAGYLINLATRDEPVFEKSLAGQLGLPFVVLHPGSHKKIGEELGLKQFTEGMDKVLESADNLVKIAIETTAGQGTNLGYQLEHLKTIRELSKYPEKVVFCLDTCHMFAAGYDFKDDYPSVKKSLENILGFEHIVAIHMNDSKQPYQSKKDRHEHIGEGFLTDQSFINLMNDPDMKTIPKVLETPKEDTYTEDRINLKRLVNLLS